jgi:hypothetical protein
MKYTESEIVFTGSTGRVYTRSVLDKAFRRAKFWFKIRRFFNRKLGEL